MVQSFKVQQVAALVGAVSAAAILFVGLSGSAKAAEERLHSTSQKIFGLIPPGEGNKGTSAARSFGSETTMKTGPKRDSGKTNTAGNEPKVEDPPLPSYDGPNDNTMASNEGVGTSGIN